MSNLFNSFLEAGKSAMSIWASNSDPHVVRSVSSSTYSSSPIKLRGESVMVYGPLVNRKNSNGGNVRYDVVVQSPNSCFCVFWTPDWSEAERHFRMYDSILSNLLRMDPSLLSIGSLTTICQTIRQDSSQNIAHVVVKMDLRQIMNDSVVLNDMNGLNYLGQSPFHLAIIMQNIHAINYLIGKKVNMNNVDIDKNNVYHFGAVTTKEIIETLAEDPSTLPLINSCNNEGHTPLHIACLKDKPECVKALLCAGADANVTGSVLSSSSSERRLSSMPSDSGMGIKEIIENYPKQLQTKDIKNGGTPLHWATSKEIIEALLDSGCFIDAKNFKGKTALHIMVAKKRLDCALALIVRSASIDMSEDEFGNSPLHDAVDIGHIQLIKALLVFNANPLSVNKEGLTPWGLALKKCQNASVVESISRTRIAVLHSLHAVGASQQFSSIPDVERKTYETEFAKLEVGLSCKNLRPRSLFDSFLNSAAAATESGSGGKGRLLSLDGGGIKGLVLTTMLKYMEKRFQTPIVHCFDWMAGTSTGGILALALLSGKTVDECQMLYYRLKDKVFGGENSSRPYHSGPFDKLLQMEFGTEASMSHLPPQPRVMVTATLADRSPPDLMLFRNYKSPQAKINIPDYENPEISTLRSSASHERLIWKAARASGAAPSFFRPEECFVDGGIMSNNPSIDLLTEINEHNVVCRFLKKEDEVCVPRVLISLGTGNPPVKRTKVVDIFRPNSATETFKLFLGWDGMGKLMLDSILDTDGRIVDRTRSWCMSAGIKYHRISPPLLEDVELDATEDKALVELMWNVLAYCVAKDDEIMGLAPYLVDGYRS